MFKTDNAKPVPVLPGDWSEALHEILGPSYLNGIFDRLREETERGTVYPDREDIFRAFTLTPLAATRVVLLGQDPYHGAGQAHGLSFSVPAGQAFPPSLRNIFKEQQRDLGITPPLFGDLTAWARQGVLLLNTCLTVRANAAGSHRNIGWERFTDAVIRVVCARARRRIIFLLWGGHAQKKRPLIDTTYHHVLEAPHPSPLSAHRGFIGCGHFSKVDQLLEQQGGPPIHWELT